MDGMRRAQIQEYRNQWEMTRWAVATSMAPHLKKPIDPRKLLTLPWEQKSTEEIVATVRKYADIFAKLTPPAEA